MIGSTMMLFAVLMLAVLALPSSVSASTAGALGGFAPPSGIDWRAGLRRLKEILTVWASAFTDASEVNIIKHMFRTGSWTKPTQLTVDLYTATPGETGGGTIVSGGSYAGVRLDPDDANWAATSGTDGTTSNLSAITFPSPTANWGVITSFSITDQTSMVLYGALTTNKTVNNGDAAPNFPIGSLVVVVA